MAFSIIQKTFTSCRKAVANRIQTTKITQSHHANVVSSSRYSASWDTQTQKRVFKRRRVINRPKNAKSTSKEAVMSQTQELNYESKVLYFRYFLVQRCKIVLFTIQSRLKTTVVQLQWSYICVAANANRILTYSFFDQGRILRNSVLKYPCTAAWCTNGVCR